MVEKFPLGLILRKRVSLIGTTLRARSNEYKAELVQRFSEIALPAFNSKTLKPLIDKEFSLEEIVEAHKYMEANLTRGKVIIRVIGERYV